MTNNLANAFQTSFEVNLDIPFVKIDIVQDKNNLLKILKIFVSILTIAIFWWIFYHSILILLTISLAGEVN